MSGITNSVPKKQHWFYVKSAGFVLWLINFQVPGNSPVPQLTFNGSNVDSAGLET